MPYTITSAEKTFTQAITIAAPSGTYTQQDSLITSGAFSLTNGTYGDNGYSLTCLNFLVTGSSTRILNLSGVTTPTITTTSNFWQANTTSSTINHTGTIYCPISANTRTFIGGGATYGTLTYTVAGSTGELGITGSNSFAAINFSDATNARSLKFTKATITTIRNGNGFNVRGTSGKLMTIDTIDGAGVFTLTSTNVQSTDYMNVIRSTVDASPKWYAGANSTNGGTNTNWLFQAAPVVAPGNKVSKNLGSLLNLSSLG